MCGTFTDDDIGKLVETASGETVGVVAAVDGTVARVSPVPTTEDSDPLTPSMGTETDEVRPIEAPLAREVTDDRVVLTEEAPVPTETETPDSSGRTTEATTDASGKLDEKPTGPGATVDPEALTEDDPEAELSVDDVDRRTDAAVSVDDEPRRTDAAVDSDDDARRSDAELESDES
ncbi:hypothetical protein CV102_12400 [Natronococcus pandeyae]|uniref:Uncharacterized protein n=1 Tax=Natronococcus pandeyae TaxID=2055836 RepID=A0A8J8TS35_9EURY|nr:hypothetical protein [Natronococcus pandeyae]TYL38590.1 hypothetical protein CV102_12400 [Natronococcus pandeyae]